MARIPTFLLARSICAVPSIIPKCLDKLTRVVTSVAVALPVAIAPVFTDSADSAKASGERTLWVHYTHTGETEKVTFRRNGRYVEAGLKRMAWLTRDWRRNEPRKMDPRLFDLVWAIYQESGATKPIHIVSGYRSKKTNDSLRRRSRGVARFSQHTLGKAMDFYIPGVSVKKLREIGLKMGIGGVGYYPGSRTPFVHMDTGRVRHWPRMSPKQLAAVFPNGKTLHTSTNGRKLPRYAEALKEHEAKKTKLIQPLSKSKRTRIVRAEEGERNGILGGLFRRGDKKEPLTTPTSEKPVVIASSTNQTQATSKAEVPKVITAAVPRSRPASAPSTPKVITASPTVVAAHTSDEDTTPIPSRIGREDGNSEVRNVAFLNVPPPRPLPQGARDTFNNNAIVTAQATTNGPKVISADAARTTNLELAPDLNIDRTVTAALLPSQDIERTPTLVRANPGSAISNPTELVLRPQIAPIEKQTSTPEVSLAYAPASNPVDELPRIDAATFGERFGHFEVAKEAIRAAAAEAKRKTTRPKIQDATFAERFEPAEELKPYSLASINTNPFEDTPVDPLKQALDARLKKSKLRTALLPETQKPTGNTSKISKKETAFKTKILNKIQTAGLLTAPISSYQKLDLPDPNGIPELFENPSQVYFGSFSHKGDQGTLSRFGGKAIAPTPVVSFSPVRFSQLNK